MAGGCIVDVEPDYPEDFGIEWFAGGAGVVTFETEMETYAWPLDGVEPAELEAAFGGPNQMLNPLLVRWNRRRETGIAYAINRTESPPTEWLQVIVAAPGLRMPSDIAIGIRVDRVHQFAEYDPPRASAYLIDDGNDRAWVGGETVWLEPFDREQLSGTMQLEIDDAEWPASGVLTLEFDLDPEARAFASMAPYYFY